MPFMDNLSKIGKTVGKGASSVAKKSGDIVEISKLNLNIASEQDNILGIYEEIGKLVYEKYKNGDILEEDFDEKCTRVSEIEEKIKDIKKKILEIKNIKSCPKCGNEMALDIAFCPQCGEKQEIPMIDECESTSVEHTEECNAEVSPCEYVKPRDEDDTEI